jgi:hypothetical protein
MTTSMSDDWRRRDFLTPSTLAGVPSQRRLLRVAEMGLLSSFAVRLPAYAG